MTLFDNVRKTWNNAKKKLKAADLKRKMALVLRWTTFRVAFSEKLRSFHKKFPHWASHLSFFSPPNIVSFSVCHLAVANLWEKAYRFKTFLLLKENKSFKKKLHLRKKKMVWLIIHTFSKQKWWSNVKILSFKEISSFFSTLALFEQLDWKENGVTCKFPLLNVPLFFSKVAISVEKKKDYRQVLFLCFV